MKTIEIEHKKGKRIATFKSVLKMLYLILFAKPDYIHLVFTEDSKYKLPDHEQADWNKVGGKGSLAYSFKTKGDRKAGHKNERLIAWRFYNETFQYCYYYRENYNFNFTEVKDVKPYTLSEPIKFKDWIKGIKPLPSNFGGTLPAVKNIKYYIKWTKN